MNINPLSGLLSGASTQTQRANTKAEAAVASLLGGNQVTQISDNVSGISAALQLQNQLGGLKKSGVVLAQNLSLAQVAQGAANKQSSILGRLENIATQATKDVTPETRRTLNDQFNSLIQELNAVAGNTKFDGKNLLDGTLKVKVDPTLENEGQEEPVTLSIEDLSAVALFKGKTPSLLTAEEARRALAILQDAKETVSVASDSINDFTQKLNYRAVSLESAIFNQDAARTVLSDSDFSDDNTGFSQAIFQKALGLAVQTQTKRLPPSMLELVQ